MESNYLEILDTSFESFKNSNLSVEDLKDELSYYESLIPEFFSKKGEAEGIHKMYDDVTNESTKTVDCVDVRKSSNIYEEYLEGMMTFINDIRHINIQNDNVEFDQFTEKFDTAKKNDSIFIQSIFGGNINSKQTVPIKEATDNVEFLIDFIPKISSMKSQCTALATEMAKEKNDLKKGLLEKSVTMMIESVGNYCYSTIKSIFETYTDIIDTLATEQVVNTEEFKLV